MECTDHVGACSDTVTALKAIFQSKKMENEYKIYEHNPPHLFCPGSKYIITGATYGKKPWLKSDEAKERLLTSIKKGFDHYHWTLEDWVILDNHYHLMGNAPEDASTLSLMINDIHRFIALWIKKNVPESKDAKIVMYNYWDTCITYEKSYLARLNYIWYNPMKHGYVEDASDWKFGSYYERIKVEKEEMEELRKKYKWDKVKVKDDF